MLSKFVLLLLLAVTVLGVHLGITKDFSDNDEIISYSSIIRYKTGKDIPAMTNDRIANLLRTAYAEMVADFQQRRLPADRLPSTMIAFATEHDEIYFASSMKEGRNIFIQLPVDSDDPIGRFDKIRRLLKACQFGNHPEHHNYLGRCGEPSVIEMYMSRHNGYLVDEKGPIAGRILPWNGQRQTIVSPCADGQTGPGRYGCQTFLMRELPRVERVTSAVPDASRENDLNP